MDQVSEPTHPKNARILIVEDDSIIAKMMSRALSDRSYSVQICSSAEDALVRVETENHDLIITDLTLSGMDGLELIKVLNPRLKGIPIILITAFGSADIAIKATKSGAYDYLTKPFLMEDLLSVVDTALSAGRREDSILAPLPMTPTGCRIVGKSRAMQEVCKAVGRLAADPITVLIRGETGAGKELVARALHEYSDRKHFPFVAVNCVAIPDTLLESELFGHERGAFTGATSRRAGKFEQAHQSTLFLDEIGDISLETQGKLLRVLQERSIQRVGGHENVPVNVRVISATNRNLEEAIAKKLFREDLFYRLNGAVVRLPPLRERKEDIPDLVQHFLGGVGPSGVGRQKAITSGAVQLLAEHDWPGNIRELENLVHRAAALTSGPIITREKIYSAFSNDAPRTPDGQPTIRDCVNNLLNRAEFQNDHDAYCGLLAIVEKELYAQAIKRSNGNLTKVSEWLGVSRPTVRQKLIRYRLTSTNFEPSDAPESPERATA